MTICIRRILMACAAAVALHPVSVQGCEYYAEHFIIGHPWSDPAPAQSPAVPVYMHFEQIEADDRFIGASTPVAARVELRGATELRLRSGSEVELEAGHAHLVLIDTSTALHFGRQYPLALEFERAGVVEVEFIVGEH
ncbi:MAG TPA: copper chaperone PCu(A)C [Steroidobacteraceae bacterium]|nr:copper chaperone PCu(A)C [Steroidobacteraceae bacterium]